MLIVNERFFFVKQSNKIIIFCFEFFVNIVNESIKNKCKKNKRVAIVNYVIKRIDIEKLKRDEVENVNDN